RPPSPSCLPAPCSSARRSAIDRLRNRGHATKGPGSARAMRGAGSRGAWHVLGKDLLSRRDIVKGSAALAAVAPAAFATRVLAQAPEPAAITPALVEAAKKEGKLAFYTAMDIPVAERFAKAFEAKFPGVAVRVERSGSERVYQRIEQE